MNNKIHLRLVSAVLACALAVVAYGTSAQPYGTAAQPYGTAAQQKKKPRASKEPVVKERLVFAVNEGATTSVTHVELLQRYAGLADAMENALRRPIKVEVYPDTARFRT